MCATASLADLSYKDHQTSLHLIPFRDYLRVLSGDIDTELGVDPEEDLEPGECFSIEEHFYQIHLSYLFKGCVTQRGISRRRGFARVVKSCEKVWHY